jgi:peptide-methionine (S)-S-oxide reductase
MKTIKIMVITAVIVSVMLWMQGYPDLKGSRAMNLTQNTDIQTQKATFAAGCFWHVQYEFDRIAGVVSTVAGYTGGTTENPTYKQVCTGKTGHAEAVEVTYDPNKVSYEDLLKAFFQMHNPTTLNRQGWDVGLQYRSAIFYHNENQRKAALDMIDKLSKSGKFPRPIVTEVKPAGPFYKAEDYHQKYAEKHSVVACPAF